MQFDGCRGLLRSWPAGSPAWKRYLTAVHACRLKQGFVVTPKSVFPLLAALILTSSCASAPVIPAVLVMSCDQLVGSAPDGTMVLQADMPLLLNPDDVHRRLVWIYKRQTSRRAVLQLLVQPDGTVSHGCVRVPSGDADFDQAALQSAEVARFRPGHLAGTALDAWVIFPVSIGL
jgi:TonB family protein